MNKLPILTLGLVTLVCSLGGQKTLAANFPGVNKEGVIWEETQDTLSVQNLEQQAQQLYETGQLQQAIPILEKLIATYQQENNLLGQGAAWRNLALIYQKLGELQSAQEAIATAIELIQTGENSKLFAQALEVQGQIQLTKGQTEEALDTWKQATKIYEELEDLPNSTRSQINEVQALHTLGLHAQAVKTLETIQKSLEGKPNNYLKAKALQSLGDVYRNTGKLPESKETLETSLAIAQQISKPEMVAATLISLGNTARLQKETQVALDYYQQAIKIAPNQELITQGQLNQLSLLVEAEKLAPAKTLVPQIKDNLNQLPPSQVAIYGRINLVQSLLKSHKQSILPNKEIAQILAAAISDANSLGDQRAKSYGLGTLGRLYQNNQQWQEAKELTEQALVLSQGSNAADISYQWQWQLGKILKSQGEREAAIAAYSQAVESLKSLRGDLVAVNREADSNAELQFSFTESVEPVYRELVALLLETPETQTKGNSKSTKVNTHISQDNLRQAREVIESLQLAEMDNFFRDACLDAKPTDIDGLDSSAAIFYTIVLEDSLQVILALPGQPLRSYTTKVPQAEIERTFKKMLTALTVARKRVFIGNFLKPSQKAYDWIIRPIEKDLAASNIKNLVFIPDGGLRSIPLNSLHDGEQYLAQKYSVSLAPSLQLVDPKPLARESIQVLGAGLTEARQGFKGLPNVDKELERIQQQVPGEILLNESFTEDEFQTEVEQSSYQIVHLATHGEFSSKAEDTFLLTWDDRLDINELKNFLQGDRQQTRPIELLVLSACKTAAGDKRAALGLAGVAVRAGARSTLASLWYVSDEATAILMTKFYEELSQDNNITKAEALRRAQLSILENKRFSHPYYWSAFVLVGNWL